LIKNFFKYKSGVSHYHSGAKAQSGMIDYTFLLPGKNDICKAEFLSETKKVRLIKLIVFFWWRRPFREQTLICCLLSDISRSQFILN